MKARGKSSNDARRDDGKWDAYVDKLGLKWAVRVEVPFDRLMSKNSIWSYGSKQGHVFIRQEVKNSRESVANAVGEALRLQPMVHGKLWLGIYVQKPTFKGDAINVIDSIADAVKTVVAIDDNMYSLMFVDWDVVFENPKVILYIGQHHEVAQFQCSYCGQLQPVEKYKGPRLCLDCSPRKVKL